jgi:hypothetical protein
MMGGALGLAVLASLAAHRTGGSTAIADLNGGYHVAFLAGAIFAAAAAAVAAILLRSETSPAAAAAGEPVAGAC